MNTRQRFASVAIAAVAAFAGTAAFAQEATSDAWMNAASTKTRAEVQAELARARAAGELTVTEADYGRLPRTPGVASRDAVRAELAAARASGEWRTLGAEAYDFVAARHSAPRTVASTQLAQSATR